MTPEEMLDQPCDHTPTVCREWALAAITTAVAEEFQVCRPAILFWLGILEHFGDCDFSDFDYNDFCELAENVGLFRQEQYDLAKHGEMENGDIIYVPTEQAAAIRVRGKT